MTLESTLAFGLESHRITPEDRLIWATLIATGEAWEYYNSFHGNGKGATVPGGADEWLMKRGMSVYGAIWVWSAVDQYKWENKHYKNKWEANQNATD